LADRSGRPRAGAIVVALETPHGLGVEALMDRGVAVFAIHPKWPDCFGDRLSLAGVKDDRRDPLVLASLAQDGSALLSSP
jgi:hypothetical protein